MEPGSELEEPRHAPALTDQSLGRPKDPGDHLQERALAGAVVPDQREELPLGDVERDVAQGPEILGAGPAGEQTLLQRRGLLPVDPEALGEVLHLDRGRHSSSAKSPDNPKNTRHVP